MRLFSVLLLFLPLKVFGQDFSKTLPEVLPVTQGVVEIKQTNYNRGFFPSRWKSFYRYDNGKLMRQINYFRGELSMDEIYE